MTGPTDCGTGGCMTPPKPDIAERADALYQKNPTWSQQRCWDRAYIELLKGQT